MSQWRANQSEVHDNLVDNRTIMASQMVRLILGKARGHDVVKCRRVLRK